MIEEDAYEKLQDYLDRLTLALKNEDGSNEIVEDVEIRIAELCSEVLDDNKTVIELKDIEAIISKLGDPEDYVDESEDENYRESAYNYSNKQSSEKRLFRDEHNATIGGVCAGIASFLNVDVVIIRAIFILFFFLGFGILLYIILWIIVPKAESSIDRLRMKGRPITVETVREEVEMAASKIKDGSKKFTQSVKRNDGYKKSVNKGARVLASLLGIGLIAISVFILIPFLIFIVGGFEFIPLQGDNGFMSFPEFGKLVMSSDSDYGLMWIGVLLIGFSAVVFLSLSGIMLLMRIKSKVASFALIALFATGVAGIILTTSMGVRTGRDFAFSETINRELGTVSSDVLTIKPMLYKTSESDDYTVINNDGINQIEVGETTIRHYGVNIKYVRSADSNFHISENITAQSESHRKALTRCENVEHKTKVVNDTLSMDTYYSFPKTDKWRAQRIKVIIAIPDGKEVHFNNHIIRLGDYEYIDENEQIVDSQEGFLKSGGKYKHWN